MHGEWTITFSVLVMSKLHMMILQLLIRQYLAEAGRNERESTPIKKAASHLIVFNSERKGLINLEDCQAGRKKIREQRNV